MYTKALYMTSEYVVSVPRTTRYQRAVRILRDAPAGDSEYLKLRLEYDLERVTAALSEEIRYISAAPHSLSPHEYENVKRLCDVFVQLHKAARKAR